MCPPTLAPAAASALATARLPLTTASPSGVRPRMLRTCVLAPAPSSASTAGSCPALPTAIKHVHSHAMVAHVFIARSFPYESRCCGQPCSVMPYPTLADAAAYRAARCSAALSAASKASAQDPLSKSTRTQSAWPPSAARCSGDRPPARHTSHHVNDARSMGIRRGKSSG